MKKSSKNRRSTSKSIVIGVTKAIIKQVEGNDLAALKQQFPVKYADKKFLFNLNKDAENLAKLPEPQTRISPRKQSRDDLKKIVKDINTAAQILKQYIRYGFSSTQVDSMYESAAITANYAKSAIYNWVSAAKMINGMTDFVAIYQTDLSTKGSMPATFPSTLKQYQTTFLVLREQYESNNAAAMLESQHVVDAINKLKKQVQNICNDARMTFAKDEKKRNAYAFTTIERNIILDNSSGEFRSGIYDAISQRPIFEGSISTDYFDKKVLSNKRGRFVINQLPAGTYTFIIMAKGYQPITLKGVVIKKGKGRNWPKIMMEKAIEIEDQ